MVSKIIEYTLYGLETTTSTFNPQFKSHFGKNTVVDTFLRVLKNGQKLQFFDDFRK